MNQAVSYGEVTIRPGLQGLIITVAAPVALTLPNQSREVSLRKRLLLLTIGIIGILLVPHDSHAATYTPEQIIRDTNNARAANGVPALIVDERLQRAATAKANDMFGRQYFSHYSPVGQAPWKYFSDNQYTFTVAGENLAIDFVNGERIVPSWMSSTNHRQNILNRSFRDIGVAVVDGVMHGQATTIVVQFFGRPTQPSALHSSTELIAPAATVLTEPQSVHSAHELRTSEPAGESAQLSDTITHGIMPRVQGIVSHQALTEPGPMFSAPLQEHIWFLVMTTLGYESLMLGGLALLNQLGVFALQTRQDTLENI